LPILIPKFIQPPMNSFNSKAIASMSEVSGSSLCSHLSTIIPALVSGVYDSNLQQNEENLEIANNLTRVVKSIDVGGLDVFIDQFLVLSASLVPSLRLGAAHL